MVGEGETDGTVLVLRRIYVTHTLRGVSPDRRAVVERVHELHADFCPVVCSIRDTIEITTSLVYGDTQEESLATTRGSTGPPKGPRGGASGVIVGPRTASRRFTILSSRPR